MSKKNKLPPRRSSLLLIALILLGSAAVRAIHQGDGLTAFAADAMIDEEPEVIADLDDEFTLRVRRATKLLANIKKRSALLDEREAELAKRSKFLENTEDEIRKKLMALEAAEQSLRSTMALASSAAEDDLAKLTAVYENMKPKDAAALFEEMDPEFAAGFLSRMRPDAAAAVLAGLEADKAYSVSVVMAGRNADVPSQ